MKTSELRELDAAALEAKIREARKEYFDLRIKFKSKAEVDKPVRMRFMRKDIARMLTVLNAKNRKEA